MSLLNNNSLETPVFPEMRPLELEDRGVILKAFAKLKPQQSEFTFTNFFIWRYAYQFKIARIADAIIVFSLRSDPEDSFVFPPLGGSGSEAVRECLAHLESNGHNARLCRATKGDLQRLALMEDKFEIEPDRDQWDYVYLVQDLVKLEGKRYHRKRNHIEQFVSKYSFIYRSLTPDLVSACQELQDQWCDEKHCDLVGTLRAEARVVKEVLANYESLDVIGGCIEVEGKIRAFTLGELLNPETVVIHIEKADSTYHGLYQLINQQFLAHEWPTIQYVNREQDIGEPGLHKAKNSYYPDHMIEKYIVSFK